MRRCLSKIRLEIKGTGLEGEDLSEKKQLLEDITEKFEESKRRFKTDTQKKQCISKAQKMRKNQWKYLEKQKT